MLHQTAPLEPDCYYHIYNRANGRERIFLSDENYRFFLAKYTEYVAPFTDLFSYCLMPNHFHFLVRVKGEEEIEEILKERNLPGFENLEGLSLILSRQFSNFFNCYAKAFNKQNGRKGSLFMKNFKRLKVEDEKYLLKLIHYIHKNPSEAGLVQNDKDWKYNSYSSFFSRQPSAVRREEVIGLLGDLENFIFVHQSPPEISGIE